MSEGECCVEVSIPPPIVKRPRLIKFSGVDLGTRVGRGYSINEIKTAGINIKLAKQFNIPIDPRRKSVYEENVKNLENFLQQIKELINIRKAKPAKNVQQRKEAATESQSKAGSEG